MVRYDGLCLPFQLHEDVQQLVLATYSLLLLSLSEMVVYVCSDTICHSGTNCHGVEFSANKQKTCIKCATTDVTTDSLLLTFLSEMGICMEVRNNDN